MSTILEFSYFDKIRRSIESCRNSIQLLTCLDMVELFLKRFPTSTELSQTLEDMIFLKYECLH